MPQTPAERDINYMQRALRLAARGQGEVEPNPMVGCVVVKSGQVVGEGFHRRFGGPHAEAFALKNCVTSPRGATVYVTLEPCCYHGKTPPCTDALIEAGVKRVVAAVEDPNPRVAGGGLKLLAAAGIDVRTGVCAAEATALNAPFAKLITRHRPWVILKWAQSLDGKIATRTGDAKWITDEQSRGHAHRVRGRVDAVVVGLDTVRRDDPLLTSRVGRADRVATRIVLDPELETPQRAQLVTTAHEIPTLIFCGTSAPATREKRLLSAGCSVERVRRGPRGLALPAILDRLGKRQFTNVLVEGGGETLGHFFDQGLADEVHVYVAPLLIGGRDAVTPLHAKGVRRVADAIRLDANIRTRRLGNGWFAQARL